MFYLEKTLEISAAHLLKLNYDSKCNNLHGHNWSITIHCKNNLLDANGMVIDFTKIKEIVNELDHHSINEFIEQPTAENIAKFLCDKIEYCYKVKVIESNNNIIVYEKI